MGNSQSYYNGRPMPVLQYPCPGQAHLMSLAEIRRLERLVNPAAKDESFEGIRREKLRQKKQSSKADALQTQIVRARDTGKKVRGQRIGGGVQRRQRGLHRVAPMIANPQQKGAVTGEKLAKLVEDYLASLQPGEQIETELLGVVSREVLLPLRDGPGDEPGAKALAFKLAHENEVINAGVANAVDLFATTRPASPSLWEGTKSDERRPQEPSNGSTIAMPVPRSEPISATSLRERLAELAQKQTLAEQQLEFEQQQQHAAEQGRIEYQRQHDLEQQMHLQQSAQQEQLEYQHRYELEQQRLQRELEQRRRQQALDEQQRLQQEFEQQQRLQHATEQEQLARMQHEQQLAYVSQQQPQLAYTSLQQPQYPQLQTYTPPATIAPTDADSVLAFLESMYADGVRAAIFAAGWAAGQASLVSQYTQLTPELHLPPFQFQTPFQQPYPVSYEQHLQMPPQPMAVWT
ncbi:hypothetical protein C8R43DRAFT_183816 [Mycena crocata]|nr:hypothetical protein C8R43DRAFT_183816 [Mycena crocata]